MTAIRINTIIMIINPITDLNKPPNNAAKKMIKIIAIHKKHPAQQLLLFVTISPFIK